MSTPAQKPRPSARRITTRLSATRPAAVTASARPNQPATSSAFTGGWSITTSAMPGRFWWVVMGMTCSGFGSTGAVPPAATRRASQADGAGALGVI